MSGTSPCKNCGIAVEVEDESRREWMLSIGKTVRGPDGSERIDDRERRIAFAVCADCQKLHEQAVKIVTAHPAVRQQLGSRYYAIQAVANTLFALDALEVKPTGVTIVFSSDARMLAATRLLGAHGEIRFSSLWVPIIHQFDQFKRPFAQKRWGHLSAEQRVTLSGEYVELLRIITEKLTAYAPPAGAPRGCLLCGRGTVEVMPSVQRAGRAWFGPYRAQPGLLGEGRTHASGKIEGYLCPTCNTAAENAGAIGRQAMERSVLAHLDSIRSPLWAEAELVGFGAWCALPEGTAPNREPWGHVDLGPVRAILTRKHRVLTRVG